MRSDANFFYTISATSGVSFQGVLVWALVFVKIFLLWLSAGAKISFLLFDFQNNLFLSLIVFAWSHFSFLRILLFEIKRCINLMVISAIVLETT